MGQNRVGEVLVETYKIERLIAEGGMGAVYEARHLRLPKRFAVKFLNVTLVDNDEAQARFRREAEIIAALDHPNIVSLLDYNVTDEGVPFIVMEFLDGEHLGKRIGRGKIALAEAMRIIAPVVNALSAAHERNIVHRDLKPENIVLVRGGEQVKVVDFGIAKIRGGQELTAMNMILGTIPYMAPEQLFGTSVDARTDQFALGAIVYEMLSGDMAFGGGQTSVPEVAARVAHFQPAFIAGVPAAVNEVVLQAMAKMADARFPSMRGFYEALVAAASKPDEPPVVVDLGDAPADEGLPELAGEATVVSVAPGASQQSKPVALHPVKRDAPDLAKPAGYDEDSTVQIAAAAREPSPPPGELAGLSTVQVDRAQIKPEAPAPAKIRETAQVNMSQVSTQKRMPVAEVPTEALPQLGGGTDQVEVPHLSRSTGGIWLVIAVVVASIIAIAAWALLRKPM